MVSSTIFFWVLPVLFVALTAIFIVLAYSNKTMVAARKGAAAFGIGVLAIIIDTQRQYFPSGFFTLAVPMHWMVIICLSDSFLSRRGGAVPRLAAGGIFLVGLAINLWSTFIFDSVVVRVTNTSLIAIALISLSLPQLFRNRVTLNDKLIFCVISFSVVSYIIRLIIYFISDQSTEYESYSHSQEWSQWSQYVMVFYFTTGIVVVCMALLLILAITTDIIEQHHAATTRDSLTGIANRRGFDMVAERHSADKPLYGAVMMIDLDRFKRINDRYGHAGGDMVLVATARTLTEGCAGFAEVARMGGEEFALLVRTTHAEAAQQLAELLRTSIAAISLAPPFEELRCTASIGIAQIATDETITEALRRADIALYKAKQAGRNRVTCAPACAEARVAATVG